MTWMIPLDELTIEQIRAVNLTTDENKVILGGPGSGKTLVLLHRANAVRIREGVAPARLRIFVYTNVLKAFIQSGTELVNIPQSCVTTFDKWCIEYHQRHIGRRYPRASDSGDIDFNQLRLAVLKRLGGTQKLLDLAMVDEGQDLDGVAFEILGKISRHVTVCMDYKQQLYRHGISESEVLKRLQCRNQNVSFLELYRGCPYVAELAAQFIPNPLEQEQFLRQSRMPQVERETPLFFLAGDESSERVRLLQVLKTRLMKGEKIGIIFPHNAQIEEFGEFLEENGIESEGPKELSFLSDRPKLLTYYGAKGLTFDSVFLPDLVPEQFANKEPDEILRLLFVGIGRATKFVFLSTRVQTPLKELSRLIYGKLPHLSVQKDGAVQVPETQTSSTTPKRPDDLLDLF